MSRAISNANIVAAKFDLANFTGEWLASFGRPELRGSWLVWSGSYCGKTSFVLRLCKYLAMDFGKTIAYNSLEEGLSSTFQAAWLREDMPSIGARIVLLEKEPIDELKKRLKRRKSPDVVVIDSLVCLFGFSRREYMALMNEFPEKLFIFLCHEKRQMPDPSIGEVIRRLSDVKIHIEGYVAQVGSRYADHRKGEGVADFMIWPEGAMKYRALLAELEEKARRKSRKNIEADARTSVE